MVLIISFICAIIILLTWCTIILSLGRFLAFFGIIFFMFMMITLMTLVCGDFYMKHDEKEEKVNSTCEYSNPKEMVFPYTMKLG